MKRTTTKITVAFLVTLAFFFWDTYPYYELFQKHYNDIIKLIYLVFVFFIIFFILIIIDRIFFKNGYKTPEQKKEEEEDIEHLELMGNIRRKPSKSKD